MANKHRFEVDVPAIGDGHFLRFTLDDLEKIESEFGENFFDEIEKGCANYSTQTIRACLSVGLKSTDESGVQTHSWAGIDQDKLQENGFTVGAVAENVLEAIVQAWLGKSYSDLVKEAQAARAKKEREQVEGVKRSLNALAEASEEADAAKKQAAVAKDYGPDAHVQESLPAPPKRGGAAKVIAILLVVGALINATPDATMQVEPRFQGATRDADRTWPYTPVSTSAW